MVSGGEAVLVGFSGGPDSVCLLDVLDQLKAKYRFRLYVAHFNHKLRGKSSEEDAQFAEEAVRRRKLIFISSSADVAAYADENKLSLEAAGRRLRYEFFRRSSFSVGATRVALGHTADDQAETMLMRLIRGAGPEGLAGIPPIRPLDKNSNLLIIRPLIGTWRSEIMEYVEEKKLEVRIDKSNQSLEFFRNRVRLELIPHIEREFNPLIKQRLVSAAAALSTDNDFLATESDLLAQETLLERHKGWILFDARMLAQLHPALRKRIISRLVSLAHPEPPMLEAPHFAAAEKALAAGGGRLDLPGRLILEVSEGAGLISLPPARKAPPKKAFAIDHSGTHAIPELGLLVKTTIQKTSSPSRLIRQCTPTRQYFDLKKVKGPLEVRVRRPGDAFQPLGTLGRKKLKDFFIDKKVPRFLRQRVPLLVSDSRIMWVMGYAIDEHFMLKPTSTSALRVDYEKASPGTSH